MACKRRRLLEVSRPVTSRASDEPLWLSRILRPITIVEPGEATSALLLTLNVFLLLCAYYIVKPVREALILAQPSGAEYKAYMSGAIAFLLLFVVPIYAKFVDRLPRAQLVIMTTLFFALNLLLFWVAIAIPSLATQLGLIFYAWVGIFGVMGVAQFWSFASDVYDEERGTRLFPLLALGGSLGAVFGAQGSAWLIPVLGVPRMLGLGVLLLCLCASLFWLVERRESSRHELRPASASRERTAVAQPGPMSGAFTLVLSNRYLLLVAAFSLTFAWVNSNGEYMLGKLVQRAALAALPHASKSELGARIGACYGQIFTYVNVVGFFLQTFVVARLLRRFGFRLCFLIVPLVALGDAAAVAVAPLLAVITVGKIAENSADYSLNNTVRQLLWLVTTREQKYKAKQAIDTFVIRLGDVSSGVSVWLGAGVLALGVRYFAVLNLMLCAVWLTLAFVIGRLYGKLSAVQGVSER
jgi:AAA family ATP:ADP antiporter